MQRFWDRRARENALYFVDNRLDYRNPDAERFWADGERDLDLLLRSLGAAIQPGDHILEIGCGVGRLTRVLAARGAAVLAIDVSQRMLELARQLNPELTNVEWILGDGATLSPIASGTVDVCISHVVFQHIPDPAITLGYIREIGRVLRPEGWAAFQLSNDSRGHPSQPRWDRRKQAALALLGRGPRGQHDARWLGSKVELDALEEAIADGSMRIDRLTGAGTQFCCVLARRMSPH